MFTLINVGVPITNAEAVQTEIERCCAEIGDMLIGRQTCSETHEMLFFVLLMEPVHLSEHLKVLDQALQHAVISSFQSARYSSMVNVTCSPPGSTNDQLQTFPLRFGEVWFPDFTDHQHAFIFSKGTDLTPEQSVWLEAHSLQRE